MLISDFVSESVVLRSRLHNVDSSIKAGFGEEFDRVFDQRIEEANVYYKVSPSVWTTEADIILMRRRHASTLNVGAAYLYRKSN